MKNLDQYWYSANPVAWALLPLSWLFCTVAVLRRYLYMKNLLAGHAVPVPVIIVGNISVGGTGKTPLLIGLCDYLSRHGLKPGVVSRGYGADVSEAYSVAASDSAERCGDEPLLIRQRTGCPVVIGKDRVAAATKLLAENDCDLILSDDGLQHYRLRRNIEIAVLIWWFITVIQMRIIILTWSSVKRSILSVPSHETRVYLPLDRYMLLPVSAIRKDSSINYDHRDWS